jgi:hypothetical protein
MCGRIGGGFAHNGANERGFGFFQETKLTGGIYTRKSSGYEVLAMDAPSVHQGGIAVFWRNSPHWQVEAYRTYGPNVASFQLTSGKRRWYVVGEYILPADTVTLEQVSKALDERLEGVEPILLGDLNANLAEPVQSREHEIAAAMASHGLEDMLGHFAPRRRYRAGYTWKQSREGVLVTSRCDYLLGVDRHTFSKVCLKDPRFDSDHFMILGTLNSATLKVNQTYLRGRQKCPLKVSERPLNKAVAIFEELQLSVERKECAVRRQVSWISSETWKLIDSLEWQSAA